MKYLLAQADPEWHELLMDCLAQMNPQYLDNLFHAEQDWLPGKLMIFKAFNQPLSSTTHILLGESPYPRVESANGLAFWDDAVVALWSHSGLDKVVNRATSLRNLIKMLLHARGDLSHDFSQPAIAALNKEKYIQTLPELFDKLIQKGFLLLNASLVYQKDLVNYHARQWQPFMDHLFSKLLDIKPEIKLVLFGKIAGKVKLIDQFSGLIAEHPYNISFISNERVLEFFKPLDLLSKK